MKIEFRVMHLHKRFPLAISRGVSAGTENLFVAITQDGVTGWGESAPGISQDEPRASPLVNSYQSVLTDFFNTELASDSAKVGGNQGVTQLYDRARASDVPPRALAALDVALWDWTARNANMPLYKLLGMGLPSVPTSVTIGINSPEVVRARVPLLLQGSGVRALKIKLGSPEGIEADQLMFAQVVESTRDYPVSLRVDANGGWSVDQALLMMKWLAARATEYVEQPLPREQDEDLPALFKNRPLPVFVDESCDFAIDVPRLAPAVDGVNLKLMKCGGLTEALRIIAVAKAHNLKTMIGCMSESSLAISAAAAITSALDYVDLDSHLNLAPDPCAGAALIDGVITPNDRPGHGAEIVTTGSTGDA